MFWDPKIQLVPTLLSSKMKGKRAFHILAPLASFGPPVPPIGPIQPPTGHQHPPYGAAYGWRYPPGLRLCFNSHDDHGSFALTGWGFPFIDLKTGSCSLGLNSISIPWIYEEKILSCWVFCVDFHPAIFFKYISNPRKSRWVKQILESLSVWKFR